MNPTDGVLTAIKAAHQYETPKRHALTLPQQLAFLNFIKKTPKFQHWLPMFTFMLGTGCRISETVSLCWSDIDFESGFITIQHNLVYHDHEVGGCYFTTVSYTHLLQRDLRRGHRAAERAGLCGPRV